MYRSIIAIFLGLVVTFIVKALATATSAMFLPDRYNPAAARGMFGVVPLDLLFALLAGVAGGYVTAVIARRHELNHALGLGLTVLVMGFWVEGRGSAPAPALYKGAVIGLVTVGAAAGGLIRRRLTQRQSPSQRSESA